MTLQACRCFVEELLQEGLFELSQEEGRHATKARRLGVGDKLTVLNGRGQIGEGEISLVEKNRVQVDVLKVDQVPEVSPKLVLAMGALKQSAWDEVLQHAVELGVQAIVRIEGDHAVSVPETRKRAAKQLRWRQRMVEACKQSANPWLPELRWVDSIEDAVALAPQGTQHIWGDLGARARPWSDVDCGDGPDVWVWVGPEGDFSPRERACLQTLKGALAVSLGPRILRAETAALMMLSGLRLGGGGWSLDDIPRLG